VGAADLKASMSHTAYREVSGSVSSAVAIDEITGADPEAFSVSVCTVDGQIANLGDQDAEFPVMAAIRPLLYGLACKVCVSITICKLEKLSPPGH
jgi:glutaminase